MMTCMNKILCAMIAADFICIYHNKPNIFVRLGIEGKLFNCVPIGCLFIFLAFWTNILKIQDTRLFTFCLQVKHLSPGYSHWLAACHTLFRSWLKQFAFIFMILDPSPCLSRCKLTLGKSYGLKLNRFPTSPNSPDGVDGLAKLIVLTPDTNVFIGIFQSTGMLIGIGFLFPQTILFPFPTRKLSKPIFFLRDHFKKKRCNLSRLSVRLHRHPDD